MTGLTDRPEVAHGILQNWTFLTGHAGGSLARMDLDVQRMTQADLHAAQALAQDSGLGGAAPFIRPYLAWSPHGFLLGRDGQGHAVACVGAQRYGTTAFIGAMCVARRYQRQGLGAAILTRLLQQLDQGGCTGALLEATEAGAGLYEKLGFTTQRLTRVWCPLPDVSCGISAGPSVGSVLSSQDRVDIVALDAQCFGASRSGVIGGWLDMHAGRCFVSRAGGALTGYITAGDARIGPWVACDATDARDLLVRALGLRFAQPPAVYVPQNDRVAEGLLAEMGFAPVKTLWRMARGVVPVGRPEGLHALATAGLG